jgi:hypothetical protein
MVKYYDQNSTMIGNLKRIEYLGDVWLPATPRLATCVLATLQ